VRWHPLHHRGVGRAAGALTRAAARRR
jgi:hypothetical protein